MNLVDSFGWLELAVDGSNISFFLPPLSTPEKLLVPTICVYEVYKVTRQRHGEAEAMRVQALMQEAQIVDLTEPIALLAAEVSIQHKLALADSIILATARLHNATLWTQDAHFAGIDDVQYCAKQ